MYLTPPPRFCANSTEFPRPNTAASINPYTSNMSSFYCFFFVHADFMQSLRLFSAGHMQIGINSILSEIRFETVGIISFLVSDPFTYLLRCACSPSMLHKYSNACKITHNNARFSVDLHEFSAK